ncbi:hypothetical protein TNIN_492661 [Trichonephila inaurata madagascariensis]|uniref:Uncharacterized protein n=1 Tax=Trichonephila inaurata madagascariensis TaxID=2747483 RepID=A0A8X6YKG4_9ARAC|nr:hypothetical protein TNIN_492661 [Trichonephila inaurata madagascariensis]
MLAFSAGTNTQAKTIFKKEKERKEKKTKDRMYPPAQGRKKRETGTTECCEETPRMKNYAYRGKRDKTVVNKQSTMKRARVKVS